MVSNPTRCNLLVSNLSCTDELVSKDQQSAFLTVSEPQISPSATRVNTLMTDVGTDELISRCTEIGTVCKATHIYTTGACNDAY